MNKKSIDTVTKIVFCLAGIMLGSLGTMFSMNELSSVQASLFNRAPRVNLLHPSEQDCKKVKALWNRGWTQRFGYNTRAPRACAKHFKNLWNKNSRQTPPSVGNLSNPNFVACEKVRFLWDERNWTDRFGSTKVVSACKNAFPHKWDTNQNAQPQSPVTQEKDPSYAACKRVKSLWDQKNWTARFGDSRLPSTCKRIFPDLWDQAPATSGGHPDQIVLNYQNPDLKSCIKLLSLFNEGNWTARFGTSSDFKVSACQQRYNALWEGAIQCSL